LITLALLVGVLYVSTQASSRIMRQQAS